MAETAEFTAQEVAAHKSAGDVWMVINEKVYNVSKYLENHPGGPEVLLEAAGTDATEAFDNAGHSEDASEIMEEFFVGNLKHVGKKAAPKAVRIVGTTVEKATAPVRTGSSAKLVWLTLLSVGGFAASYAAQKYMHILPRATFKFPLTGSGLSGMGFLQGLLLGAGVLTLVDTFLVHKILGMIRKNDSFLRYPPHIKVPKSIQSDALLRRGWLDPVTYYPLPLVSKTLLSPNVYRLSFALPTKEAIIGLPIGQHVSIKAEIDGETVTRSYTPVSNNSDKGVVELVIKVYPEGKLTNKYLAKLEIGDEVQFRGPKGACKYSSGLCKKIGMLAGGTGITPMFQLIRAICENDRDTTEVSLIYANRTEEDILLRQQLDTYARKYPKNLKVHYLLDNPPAGWKFGSGFVTQDMMKEFFPAPSDDMKLMLCGPPGMINAAKKSLANLGYKQPSAMSKISDQVFLF
ncbi:NADH-cytochrome b5 reductase 1 [Paramyrothecium foliicola]|nr:NADH-cytochrome b5 reductase 1 [Paramyrothecium foliicola]